MTTKRVALLSLVLVALQSQTANAQTEAPPATDLGEMSTQELQETGWVFRDQNSAPGSTVGGILALTLGGIAHGIGHFYAGDSRTGRILLIAEGVGLGMIGTAVLVENLSGSDGGLAPVYESLLPLGFGVFGASWLLDVIGTFRGTAVTPVAVPSYQGQLGVSLGYSSYAIAGVPLEHGAVASVRADYWPFYLYSGATIGIDSDFYEVSGQGGIRLELGRRQLSYVSVEAEVLRQVFAMFDTEQFAVWSVLGSLGVSFDFGDVFPHLDGFIFGSQLGAGSQFFSFDATTETSSSTPIAFLALETSFAVRPSSGVLIEVGYAKRPEQLIGNVSQSVGTFFGTLTHAIDARIDAHLDIRGGRGLQIVASTEFFVFR